MKTDNIIIEKSYNFALRIVKLSKYLDDKGAYVISRQILKSGTSIGANVAESQYAQSKNDFVSKLSISLKEAHETEYWLRLLKDSEYINENEFNSIHSECVDIQKILTAIIKHSKDNAN